MNEHDEWLLDRSFYEDDDFEEFVWACAACGTLHFEEDRYGICPACGALVKPEGDLPAVQPDEGYPIPRKETTYD